MKAKKVKTKGIISLKKLFAIDKINDKIFKDTDRPMYYLVIEEQLTWSHFKNITREVKNNLDFSNFDAALVTIYSVNKVWDLVRIYGKNIDADQLNTIHTKYLEVLDRQD